LQGLQHAGLMVSLELWRHKPEAGGFCLYLALIIHPGVKQKRREELRFGERDAHRKTTTEILHVVQNDGLGAVERSSVGLVTGEVVARRLSGCLGWVWGLGGLDVEVADGEAVDVEALDACFADAIGRHSESWKKPVIFLDVNVVPARFLFLMGVEDIKVVPVTPILQDAASAKPHVSLELIRG
jgi:hypothetical protein